MLRPSQSRCLRLTDTWSPRILPGEVREPRLLSCRDLTGTQLLHALLPSLLTSLLPALPLPLPLPLSLLPLLLRRLLLWRPLELLLIYALLKTTLWSAKTLVDCELVDAVRIGLKAARHPLLIQRETLSVLWVRRVVVHLLIEEVVDKVEFLGALADVALASRLADEVDLVKALTVGTDPGVLNASCAVVKDGAVNRVVSVVARSTWVTLEL